MQHSTRRFPPLTELQTYSLFDREVFSRKLKWLMSLRLLFALLLLGSTIAYQVGNQDYSLDSSTALLYGLAGSMVLLSAVYGLLLPVADRYPYAFICFQIGIDSLCISLIIYVTGGYASVFSFLYLVVVIYSSVFVLKRGALLVALFCSLQFALLLVLELYGSIDPIDFGGPITSSAITGIQVIQKCAIMTAACFSVALLSGYLSEQERQSKADLIAMEAHLDRVKNLAQIGEMAAGLAHEIKNPLASLSGAIQILKGEIENNPDNRRLMHIVLRETDRLSSLVNKFLTFARPTAGEAKRMNLAKALTDIVTLFEKDSSFDHRITVDLRTLEDTYIEIDPLQLRQVVWNLLLNSAESIDGDGIIGITVNKRKNDWIMVEIIDNGCGMDDETLDAIFNPFFTTKPNGTGLGLSIVYRILETYGCRMDVKSTPGKGSVFTLFFKTVEPTR
jgi:two-component system sensor histidine kinase PilS (NtrC family)